MKPKVQVCHLVTRVDSVGGAQIHVLELVKYWQRLDVKIVIVGGQNPDTKFRQCGATVLQLPSLVRDIDPWLDIKALLECIYFLQEIRPEILMLHSSKAGVIGRIAAKFLGIPSVFTAHGWSFSAGMPQPFRSLCWLFEFVMVAWTDYIITVSKYDRQLGLKFGVGSVSRTIAIQNGVEDIPTSELAVPADSNVIIMVARHSPQKDYPTLVRALKLLHHDYKAIFIGDGPELNQTRELVASSGLTEKVNVIGACSNVSSVLSRGGIMVLSTLWEGLPRSIIEGMRSGLPVIASDVGGNSELVTSGFNGYLVPKQSPDQLAQRIDELLSNAALRSSMGTNGRNRYLSSFRSEILFERTIAAVNSSIKCYNGEVVL
jgi:glycosyltransferase involved in cell wall biosynthesis